MQVRAVVYVPSLFSDDLYHRAIRLVDSDTAARIKRFYHREDACRTLIGRLLPRAMLKERGIPLHAMSFSATETGKPYISTLDIDPPIAFNISHDNALVVMVLAQGVHGPPAFRLGIDVMKVHLPRGQTLLPFLETMTDQLTPLEYRSLSGVSEDESLRRFFWLWTMKEAYTKALGYGLGFDFRRVEYDVESGILRVDNTIPDGWRFHKFVLNNREDVYEGVVAEFIGGIKTEIIHENESSDWLTITDAAEFVEKAIHELQEPQREGSLEM